MRSQVLDRHEVYVGNELRTRARRVLLWQVALAYHQASGSQKQQILEDPQPKLRQTLDLAPAQYG
jgi:hypothetical protein